MLVDTIDQSVILVIGRIRTPGRWELVFSMYQA